MIHPDGTVTLRGTGTQFGTLGTCGTGSVRYVTEQQGTVSALRGRFRFTDQAASTSTPVKIHSGDIPAIAAGYGVQSERVTTLSDLTRTVKDALSANRPHLIEISERRLADS